MVTKRGYYLEELNRAKEGLDWTLTHLARVYEAYLEFHPDIALQAKGIGDIIVQVAELIQKLHDSI